MSDSIYTCAVCGETFQKGWTDAEAWEEFDSTPEFIDVPHEQAMQICDDCYKLGLEMGLFRGT